MNFIKNIPSEDCPQVGDLALNEDGALGVITLCRSKRSCSGYHVSNDQAPKGSVWASKNPRIVGFVTDANAFSDSLKD